jgi:Fe2+ or Zn2+ uptake regulation protein
VSSVKESESKSTLKYDKKREKIIREGKYNKERIFEFIARHRKGVSVKQIHDYLKNIGSAASRPTIYSHLDELIAEKKVFQNKAYGDYFLADWQLGDIHNFAQSMKDACEMMIETSLIDRSPTDKVPGQHTIVTPGSFHIEFFKSLAGISVSKQFCDTKFDKNTLNEKYLFEFANRIGAFITYMLIETLRPVADNGSKTRLDRKKELSSALLQKAFEIKSIVKCFHNILSSFNPRLGNTFANIGDPVLYELNNDDFDRLSIAFRNVFPGIYQALEKKWNYDINYGTDWLEYKEDQGLKCNHKWERTFIYKMGIYYFCIKCHNFISEASMKYRRKMKGK